MASEIFRLMRTRPLRPTYWVPKAYYLQCICNSQLHPTKVRGPACRTLQSVVLHPFPPLNSHSLPAVPLRARRSFSREVFVLFPGMEKSVLSENFRMVFHLRGFSSLTATQTNPLGPCGLNQKARELGLQHVASKSSERLGQSELACSKEFMLRPSLNWTHWFRCFVPWGGWSSTMAA